MALRAKKYFEDYERETVLKNGKPVSVLVYKGDLYIRTGKSDARRRERIGMLLMAFAAALLLVTAMTRSIPENIGGLTASLSVLALIPAFCTVEGTVEALFRRGPLKKNNYTERFLMLRIMPILGAVLHAALCVGYGMGAARGSGALPAALCCAAAMLLYTGLAVWEIRVPYTVKKGTRWTGEQMPDGSNEEIEGDDEHE